MSGESTRLPVQHNGHGYGSGSDISHSNANGNGNGNGNASGYDNRMDDRNGNGDDTDTRTGLSNTRFARSDMTSTDATKSLTGGGAAAESRAATTTTTTTTTLVDLGRVVKGIVEDLYTLELSASDVAPAAAAAAPPPSIPGPATSTSTSLSFSQLPGTATTFATTTTAVDTGTGTGASVRAQGSAQPGSVRDQVKNLITKYKSLEPSNLNLNLNTETRTSIDTETGTGTERRGETERVEVGVGSVPQDILEYIEAGRNPNVYTRQFSESVARENQLVNGKMSGYATFADVLGREIVGAYGESEIGAHVRRAKNVNVDGV